MLVVSTPHPCALPSPLYSSQTFWKRRDSHLSQLLNISSHLSSRWRATSTGIELSRLPEYWLPPRKPYLSVLRRAIPFISESEPMELTSSGKDSKVPDMRLTESK